LKIRIVILIMMVLSVFAKAEHHRILPMSVAAVQYAGSIGWLTMGYFRQSTNKKIELGLLYGYTPEALGGEIHSIALKFIYEPYRMAIKNSFQIEPIQTGLFVTQNFTKNLYLGWPDKYDPGYYWWTCSTRFHVFLGNQVSWMIQSKTVEKVSLYFEANTNDLYLFSYLGNKNYKSLSVDDIIFFGIGSKIYFQ